MMSTSTLGGGRGQGNRYRRYRRYRRPTLIGVSIRVCSFSGLVIAVFFSYRRPSGCTGLHRVLQRLVAALDWFSSNWIRVYWLLLGFTQLQRVPYQFDRVLLGFTQFYWVLPSFTGFCLVLLDFTGFDLIEPGLTVLMSFTGFYRVLPSFTGFCLVLLGFHWFSLGVHQVLTGCLWVLRGFSGFSLGLI